MIHCCNTYTVLPPFRIISLLKKICLFISLYLCIHVPGPAQTNDNDQYADPDTLANDVAETAYDHAGKGYLITTNGDTLYGVIDIRSFNCWDNVLYIDTVLHHSQVYKPPQVLKFQLEDRTFVALQRVFAELIYKGRD
jgi:hypothetical protein